MLYFESEIKNAVNKVDDVRIHLKDTIHKASTHAKNSLNKHNIISNCKFDSNFRKNFTANPVLFNKSSSPELDFKNKIEKPRSILKFSATRDNFPQDRGNALNDNDSEVSIRHFDYDDSFTLSPTRKLKTSLHNLLSPKKSASAQKKSNQKLTKQSTSKKKESIEESLRKADEKIKEIRSLKIPNLSKGPSSKTKLLTSNSNLSRMDSVRSQSSLQCGSQKSVTFSDIVSEKEIEIPKSLDPKNKFDLKYDFEKMCKQDTYAKKDKSKNSMADVKQIMQSLEKMKNMPKRPSNLKTGKPLPSFIRSDSNFTGTQTDNAAPSTHGTQTFTPTANKSSYYDATKSQFLVKDLEENTKLPTPDIDDLLAINPDDHGKYLSKLKCKYPRFFLTRKEDQLLSDIKLQSRMTELDHIEDYYDDTNSSKLKNFSVYFCNK